jgi:hypothetical protein
MTRRAAMFALILVALAPGCVLVTDQGSYLHQDVTQQSGTNTTNDLHKLDLDLR